LKGLVLNKNKRLIKDNNPKLYELIYKDQPLYNAVVTPIEEDNLIIQHNNSQCFVHSIYDKKQEFKYMFSNSNIKNSTSTLILFGLGNGEILDYIIKNYSNIKNIIIIEPIQEVFQYFISKKDLKYYIQYFNRLHIVVNTDLVNLKHILKSQMVVDPDVVLIANLSYRILFDNYYNCLLKDLLIIIRNLRYSIATMLTNTQIWTWNTLKNMQIDSYKAEELLPVIKGKSVIVVSAGPSLEKNINLLEEAKENFIIIAVGTAIQVLDKQGIHPHFRVVVDGRSSQLEGITNNNIPLIFANQLNHSILKDYKGPLFRMILDTDYIGKYLYNVEKKEYLEVKSGASVANVTVNLIGKLQPKRIIFVGQDMCMVNKKLHAHSKDNHRSENEIEVYDIHGQKSKTILQYLTIKHDFDEQLKLFMDRIEILNATEGGLGINGVKNVTLKELVISLHPPKKINYNKEFTDILKKHPEKYMFNRKILTQLELIEKHCEEIIQISKQKNNRKENIKTIKIKYNQLFEFDFFEAVVNKMLDALFVSLHMKYNNSFNNMENNSLEEEKLIVKKCAETIIYLKTINSILSEV
jgi:hypothetical protein